MDNRRLNDVSNVKAIMMLSIIIYHCIAIWMPGGWFIVKTEERNVVLSCIAQWMNLIHIYVFTFASGYIYSVMRFERNHYNSFWIFLKKKIKRLLIPYVFVCVVWIIPFYVLFYKSSLGDIIYKYVLAYSPSQLWYIIMLFMVFVIAYLFGDKLYNLSIIRIVALFVGFETLYLMLDRYTSLPFQSAMCVKFMPYFVLGMNGKVIIEVFKNRSRVFAVSTIAAHIIFFVIYILSTSPIISIKVLNFLSATICSITGIFLVFIVYHEIEDNAIFSSHFFIELKENSFQMYLFHQQIIWCVLYVFYGKLPVLLVVLISFVLSFSVSMIISKILKRNILTRQFVGG